MGDIIQTFRARTGHRGHGRRLRLYFDTGSRCTFITEAAARLLGHVSPLDPPQPFGGLGNGRFHSSAVVNLGLLLLGTWCYHLTYVVPDDVLGKRYDILVGHDLMQVLNIRPVPKEHRVELDPVSIDLSQTVR